MRRSAPIENSTQGLIVLVVIFLLLIVGIILFSRTLIANISASNSTANALAVTVAVGLPVILLIIVIAQIVRLLRQRSQRIPGARLKARLMVFFILTSLVSAVPEVMLGVSFIDSAMGTWFSTSIGDALKGASRISMDAYGEKLTGLKSFAESTDAVRLVSDFVANPDRTWRQIQNLNTAIKAVQVFTVDGTPIAFRGDERALRGFGSFAGTNGMQTEDSKDARILHDVRPITAGNKKYVAVFSTLVSRELAASARDLTGSMTLFSNLARFQETFPIVLIAFFFLFSLPIFFITVLVSLLLTERIMGPITNLEEATQRVAEGDFSFRILTRSHDELANLVDSFNTMVSELDHSRKKLLQAEKISAWQEIAQRLAHEIRNPLTPIKLSAQRILKKHGEGQGDFGTVLQSSVSAIIKEVDNLERLLREFGEFAKLPVPQPSPTRLQDVLSEVISVYNNLSASVHIDVGAVSDAIVLNVDKNQMKRVFANLFKNAIQAMPEGGLLSVRANTVRKGHSAFCRIAVSDTGVGIEQADIGRVFDPYFTTKKDGTGLGLAIVQRVVFDHNGNVWVESEKNAGTTFFIDLPLAMEAAQ